MATSTTTDSRRSASRAASRYIVIETNGTIKWQAVIQDNSSNVTGSSVFDFEGDGSAEVVYADELKLRVYRGSDGVVLWETARPSGTTYEMPDHRGRRR